MADQTFRENFDKFRRRYAAAERNRLCGGSRRNGLKADPKVPTACKKKAISVQ